MQTADQLLRAARDRLRDTETPALDARLLLQAATGLSAADLIAEPNIVVGAREAALFSALVERRFRHEPVTRILGEREFYGRAFYVSPDVLDPRADTEVVVELCLKHMPSDRSLTILDLGTGSGAIPVTLLAERPLTKAVAVDISPGALAMALRNAKRQAVEERFHPLHSNWFGKVEGRFDIIVSNPPYIAAPDIDFLEAEVKDYDPHLALVGGADGLQCYRDISARCAAHLNQLGSVIVEIGAGQFLDVQAIFEANGLSFAEMAHDLGGHVRALRFVQRVK